MTSGQNGVHVIAASAGFVSLAALWVGILLGALIRGGWDGARLRHSTVAGLHTHLTLFGLVLGVMHALAQLAAPMATTRLLDVVAPFTHRTDPLGVGIGTLGLEVTLAVAGSVLVQRQLGWHRWLPIHSLGYAAFVLVSAHVLVSGSDTGSVPVRAAVAAAVAIALLAGIATLQPVAALRSSLAGRLGHGDRRARRRGAQEVSISVDPGRCELFGFCTHEAPELFALRSDHRLKYRSVAPPAQMEAALRAAAVCPTRAVRLGRLPQGVVPQGSPYFPQQVMIAAPAGSAAAIAPAGAQYGPQAPYPAGGEGTHAPFHPAPDGRLGAPPPVPYDPGPAGQGPAGQVYPAAYPVQAPLPGPAVPPALPGYPVAPGHPGATAYPGTPVYPQVAYPAGPARAPQQDAPAFESRSSWDDRSNGWAQPPAHPDSSDERGRHRRGKDT